MWRHAYILLLSIAAAWPVPQASSDSELRQLARLPRIEFAPPLHFDRNLGFIVFPDSATAAAQANKILEDAKYVPEDAPKYLAVARLMQAHGDLGAAIRAYGRAADLFRKRVGTRTDSAPDFAGLAEALGAIGRGPEALVQIQKALALAPEKTEVLLAAARVYQERAWQLFSGEQRLFSPAGFLENVLDTLSHPPGSARIADARNHLRLAGGFLAKIGGASEETHLQRAAFRSFESALNEAFTEAQRSEIRPAELRQKLFHPDALAELRLAAGQTARPEVVAASALAAVLAETGLGSEPASWPNLSRSAQKAVLGDCARLETMAGSGLESAVAAAEYLGCLQLVVLRDFEGGQRSFRSAVQREGRRNRSWELMVLAAGLGGGEGNLVAVCQDRFDSLPNARSGALLAKAYDRAGDALRAELICVAALAAHPKDFHLNLCLAGLLLKREGPAAADSLWRVQDCLAKAEKQPDGQSTPQNALDLALLKSIFLGLSDKPEEARAALRPFANMEPVPGEVREALRILER